MNEIVSLQNIGVTCNENKILSDVSLYVYPGEFIYLKGKTGAGKTCLLRSLFADLSINEGEAFVADFDLINISKNEIPFLRRKLGLISQNFGLLNDRNIFENLIFAIEAADIKNRKYIKNKVLQVLEKVELADKTKCMPYELSKAEKQQVVLARAIINNPVLIIADEPTCNLDSESSAIIMKLLVNESKSGVSVIVATHNSGLIEQFPGKEFTIENFTLK